jgi:cytochrome c biogenesis protein CcmG, thiol:disulfide interchange protein DsbE
MSMGRPPDERRNSRVRNLAVIGGAHLKEAAGLSVALVAFSAAAPSTLAAGRVPLVSGMRDSAVVRQAPIFTLPRLGASGVLSLQSLRGKTLVLTFWSSYDTPFQREAAQLEQAAKRWEAKGVVFVGIDAQDLATDALATMRRYRITYPNVLDTNATTLVSYNVASTPATVFVNRLGSLVGQAISGPASTAQLDSNIKIALASKAKPTGASVAVEAGKPREFSSTLSSGSVPLGWVTFNITNEGRLRHEFEVCATAKARLANACRTIGPPRRFFQDSQPPC